MHEQLSAKFLNDRVRSLSAELILARNEAMNLRKERDEARAEAEKSRLAFAFEHHRARGAEDWMGEARSAIDKLREERDEWKAEVEKLREERDEWKAEAHKAWHDSEESRKLRRDMAEAEGARKAVQFAAPLRPCVDRSPLPEVFEGLETIEAIIAAKPSGIDGDLTVRLSRIGCIAGRLIAITRP